MSPPFKDEDHALRWIPPAASHWDATKREPKATVFRGSTCSVWIRERLGGDPNVLLHGGSKTRHGRLSLAVGVVRQLTRDDGSSWGFDVVPDPDGVDEGWVHLADAHGDLQRPASEAKALSRAATAKLLLAAMEFGTIERPPAI